MAVLMVVMVMMRVIVAGAVSMIVIVRMVMIVGVTMSLRLAQPQQTLVEKRRSDGDDGQSGNYSEHRSNFFRHHVIRQEQRSQAEQKDADGVSEC
ncbi:MAG: hypothetical protein DMG59_21360, partial [Acidobacteria bacterium]